MSGTCSVPRTSASSSLMTLIKKSYDRQKHDNDAVPLQKKHPMSLLNGLTFSKEGS